MLGFPSQQERILSEEGGRTDRSVQAECQIPGRKHRRSVGTVTLGGGHHDHFFPHSHIRGENGGPCKSLGEGGIGMLCTCVCTVSEPAGLS